MGGRDTRCACLDTYIVGSRKQEVRGPTVERLRGAIPSPAPLGWGGGGQELGGNQGSREKFLFLWERGEYSCGYWMLP